MEEHMTRHSGKMTARRWKCGVLGCANTCSEHWCGEGAHARRVLTHSGSGERKCFIREMFICLEVPTSQFGESSGTLDSTVVDMVEDGRTKERSTSSKNKMKF
uniref:Uncharacterized protein n=1 Tax=Branchiostoma floridae TaxID=7739 RepID=C3YNS5_BRAFL|eukprot:XP_002602023.1 hypothetical protein BRAFLDRAFT_82612 [Branchiostoma floridae]